MMRLLHVNASPRKETSRSHQVASAFLDTYNTHRPDAKVDTFDLFEEDLPPFGADAVAAKKKAMSGNRQSADSVDIWAQVRAITDRFTTADRYLFNIPMWNFGVPYVVKQFVDIVTQSGSTFRLDGTRGYSGLLTGKKACVIYTSGVYAPGRPPAFGADFQSTYFTHWLKFVGIADVTEIHLRPTDFTRTFSTDVENAKTRARETATTF